MVMSYRFWKKALRWKRGGRISLAMGVQRDDVVHRLVGRGKELLDIARSLADAVLVLDQREADVIVAELSEANARGETLGLSEDELAFYDALETNDSAVKVLGDETLRIIAHELVETVRNNVTIDWTLRENVRAQMRVLVKRILRKYGYPPDKQEKATQTVLEQAEMLSEEWIKA